MKKILDVACGKNKVPGAIGIDIADLPNVNICHNLNKFPWPIKANSFDEIHCYHYLEHCDDVIRTMEEIHRILKINGKVIIRSPHYSGRYSWIDPTHKRSFSIGSFDYFGGNLYDYYSKTHFIVIKKRIKWFASYPNEKWYEDNIRKTNVLFVLKPFILGVQFFIDKFPDLYERFFLYYTGGAEEVYFELQKK